VRIPSNQPGLKHAFNIAISLFYMGPMLSCFTGLLQLLASTLATYFLAKCNQTEYMPWMVFVYVVADRIPAAHMLTLCPGSLWDTSP
jgi:lysophospholipid acyltransferase